MNERFGYQGSATIGGVHFPAVRLREDPRGPGEYLRSWGGEASFPATAQPEGFSGNLGIDGPVPVELPDGRRGQTFVSIEFDGSYWTLTFQGTGPAPA